MLSLKPSGCCSLIAWANSFSSVFAIRWACMRAAMPSWKSAISAWASWKPGGSWGSMAGPPLCPTMALGSPAACACIVAAAAWAAWIVWNAISSDCWSSFQILKSILSARRATAFGFFA